MLGYLGTVTVFRGYGILCGVFLAIFVGVNIYQKDEGSKNADDPDDMVNHAISVFLIIRGFFIFQPSSFFRLVNPVLWRLMECPQPLCLGHFPTRS